MAAATTSAVLVVAACSGGGAAEDDLGLGDDAESAAVTDDGEGIQEQESESPAADEAVQHYRASNDYMEQAMAQNPPNPEDPELGDYFSGSALLESSQLLFELHRDGRYYESTFDENPVVATATDEEVVLTDCLVETVTAFDGLTGDEIDSSTETYNWRVRVVLGGSGWRVDEIVLQEEACTP